MARGHRSRRGLTVLDHAGRTVALGDGSTLQLGRLLKSGGAGGVYRVPARPDCVAKVYHAHVDHALYARKLEAMLELTPDLPDLALDGKRIVQVAWPQALLRDTRGAFLGFLMPAVDVDATSELECILQERQARRLGLPTGLGAKVTLAANLAAVIAELHRRHHYVVDLKPVNLRFYRDALYMAMLDCDGFSIQGHGERFVAPQYTPDYLAPEFHARGLTTQGEAQQDRFALAVVVFQLLNFGIHPYAGRPADKRVPTDLPGRIAGRWFAHGLKPNPAMHPVPASGHAAMPGAVREMFERAFGREPALRPSADEWAGLLRGYAQRASGQLVVCGREASHQHFAGQPCAACTRAEVIKGAAAARPMAPVPAPPRAGLPPVAQAGRPKGSKKKRPQARGKSRGMAAAMTRAQGQPGRGKAPHPRAWPAKGAPPPVGAGIGKQIAWGVMWFVASVFVILFLGAVLSGR